MTSRTLSIRRAVWPIAGTFAISRGSRTEAVTLQVEVTEGPHQGHAEAVPYARYGETVDGSAEVLESVRAAIEEGVPHSAVSDLLPASAARNALDCAMLDLEAKKQGKPVHQLLGLPEPGPLTTAYTLSVDAPEAMASKAAEAVSVGRILLKLKLAGDGDLERLRAIRAAAPDARLVADANEAWDFKQLLEWAPILADLGVEMLEQPLKAGEDSPLDGYECPVLLCADESCHTAADIPVLASRYRMVNIKLDKTGGLTEALNLRRQAEAAGLGIMVGCMVGSSLAMAPAMLVAQGAKVVDLDGPLLLAQDAEPAIRFDAATMYPPDPALWG